MGKILPALAVAAATLAACQNATEPESLPDTVVLKEGFEGPAFPPAGWEVAAVGKVSLVRIYRNEEGGNHFATLAVGGGQGSAEGYLTTPALNRKRGVGFDVSFRYRRGMSGENEYARAKIYDPHVGEGHAVDLPYADDWVDKYFNFGAPTYEALLHFYVEVVEDGEIALDVDDVKVEVELMAR
ncbi:MAG: hypothetical protein V3W11_13250 [bacterium]